MHKPVLLNEVIKLLDPKLGEFIIDGTLDGGGYASAVLEHLGGKGIFLGVDWDKNTIHRARSQLNKYRTPDLALTFVADNFANLPEILIREKLERGDGLVLDLGFSSEQLENSGRGFSFLRNEPLIMTYSDEMKPVIELLKELSREELEAIINSFGEERYAKRIAHAVKERESIKTTEELTAIVKSAVPKNYERGRIHPATRTFQALRIYANKELENLELALKNLPAVLKNGGRAVIVSFHSLEDRLVKNYFRDFAKSGALTILTKKPIMASREEVRFNPRARSAKLRAAVVLKS